MAYKQEVNVPMVMTVGIISGILLLVTVIGTQAWYQSEEQDEIMLKSGEAAARSLTIELPNATFAELKKGQEKALWAKTHWVDEKKKTRVTMPIDEAMEYLADHSGKLP
jgi:hypothetical protein